MSNPMIRIVEIDGTVIDREMTTAELSQYEIDQAEELARKVLEQAKVDAKAALLDRLGITADEAKLLLS